MTIKYLLLPVKTPRNENEASMLTFLMTTHQVVKVAQGMTFLHTYPPPLIHFFTPPSPCISVVLNRFLVGSTPIISRNLASYICILRKKLRYLELQFFPQKFHPKSPHLLSKQKYEKNGITSVENH
jgi:hypothetical protein